MPIYVSTSQSVNMGGFLLDNKIVCLCLTDKLYKLSCISKHCQSINIDCIWQNESNCIWLNYIYCLFYFHNMPFYRECIADCGYGWLIRYNPLILSILVWFDHMRISCAYLIVQSSSHSICHLTFIECLQIIIHQSYLSHDNNQLPNLPLLMMTYSQHHCHFLAITRTHVWSGFMYLTYVHQESVGVIQSEITQM